MARAFEVVIHPTERLFDWSIEVEGEAIAMSHDGRFPSPMDANAAAHAWAKHHQEMGFEMRANWWEVN